MTRRGTGIVGLAVLWTFSLLGCSVPNLETPACSESKNAVREFYSFHFGNNMDPSEANIELRSKFLTDSFKQEVLQSYRSGRDSKTGDEFTKTLNDFPNAFRVGECREISPERTEIAVLLFWRDDNRTKQEQLTIEAVDKNDNWLINKIDLRK